MHTDPAWCRGLSTGVSRAWVVATVARRLARTSHVSVLHLGVLGCGAVSITSSPHSRSAP